MPGLRIHASSYCSGGSLNPFFFLLDLQRQTGRAYAQKNPTRNTTGLSLVCTALSSALAGTNRPAGTRVALPGAICARRFQQALCGTEIPPFLNNRNPPKHIAFTQKFSSFDAL